MTRASDKHQEWSYDDAPRRSSLGDELERSTTKVASSKDRRRKSSSDVKESRKSRRNSSGESKRHKRKSSYAGRDALETPRKSLGHSCPAHGIMTAHPAFPYPLAPTPIAVRPPSGYPPPYVHPWDVDPLLHWSMYAAPHTTIPPFHVADPDKVNLPNPWYDTNDYVDVTSPPLHEPKPSRLTKPPTQSALKGGRRASLLSQQKSKALGSPKSRERPSISQDDATSFDPEQTEAPAESPSARLFEGSIALTPSLLAEDMDFDDEKMLQGPDLNQHVQNTEETNLQPVDIQSQTAALIGVKSGVVNQVKKVQVRGGELWQYRAAESAELILGDESRLEQLRKELSNLETERDKANQFIAQVRGLLNQAETNL